MEKVKVGMVFGKLTVVSRFKHLAKWNCICACGNEVPEMHASKLFTGHTSSCGCLVPRHGMRYHPAYKSWQHMKDRCTNPNNQDYANYGGRGITVSPEFIKSFPLWLNEMGERPEGERWSIGRVDNNIGYVYGNMRWENDSQQARNHSLLSTNTTGINGVIYRCRIKGGAEYCTWIAQWSENNKKKSKEFSCNKYGHDKAKQLAIDYRNSVIAKLNNAGYEYAESHGTTRKILNG